MSSHPSRDHPDQRTPRGPQARRAARGASRAAWGTCRDERGAMAIEFVLVMSMLIVVFLLMLQYALKVHAERVAQAAADQALAAATAYDGSPTDGQAAGRAYLAGSGHTLLHPKISVTRTPTVASATVTGDVTAFIPFLPVSVSVHVQGPVEKFVATP